MDTCAFNSDGTVSPKLLPYMRNRAKGGVGLIIQKCAATSWPEGKNGPRELRMDVPDSITSLHDMTNDEVKKVIQDFIKCAYHAKLAGYDGIEIQAAHGYLLNCFLNSAVNKRTDEYGGDLEGRFRMVKEIIEGIRQTCGRPFIIDVRLASEDNPGNTPEDAVAAAKMCELAGADMVNMSSGLNPPVSISPTQWAEEGLYLKYSEAVKKAVSIQVAIVGKLKTPEFCSAVIESGKADLVCIGRQLLCDPEWPNKVMHDQIDQIRPCLSCFDGCMGTLLTRDEVTRCSINPYVSFEDFQSENNIPKTADPKKILVVGRGIAGMQFSIIAAKRGNKVILAEKERRQ